MVHGGFRSEVIFAASVPVLGLTFVSSSGFVGEPVWAVLSGCGGTSTLHLPRCRGLLSGVAEAAHPPTAVKEPGCFPPVPRGSVWLSSSALMLAASLSLKSAFLGVLVSLNCSLYTSSPFRLFCLWIVCSYFMQIFYFFFLRISIV